MKAVKVIRMLEAEILSLREQLARAKEESLSKKNLERGELSEAWRTAAAAERERAGLDEVDLDSEWRKLVLYVEGRPIRLGQWLRWAYRAYLDHTNQPKPKSKPVENPSPWINPTDEDWRRELSFWRKFGRFNPLYGAAPGETGCRVPAHLLAGSAAERVHVV